MTATVDLPRYDPLRRIEENDPALTLLELSHDDPDDNDGQLGYVPRSSSVVVHFSTMAGTYADYFASLGNAIGGNTHLERIVLTGFQGAAPGLADSAAFLDGLKRNSSIRTMQLISLNLSDEGICGILLDLGKGACSLTSSINKVALSGCRIGGGEGIRAIKSTLGRCTNLTDMRILWNQWGQTPRGEFDEYFPEIIGAITDPRQITHLVTPPIGTLGLEALIPVLQDAGSNLAMLNIHINGDDADCNRIATVLGRHKTLEEIRLHISNGIDQTQFWKPFARALCDTTTINGTYFSNHTLKWVRVDDMTSLRVPLVIGTILDMNRTSDDKATIAMMKVVHCHPALDFTPFFEWELKFLPIVVDRLEALRSIGYLSDGMVDNRKLRAIYQFIRGMPEAFEPAVTSGKERN